MQGRSQDFYGGGVIFARIWTPTGDFKVNAFSSSTSTCMIVAVHEQ